MINIYDYNEYANSPFTVSYFQSKGLQNVHPFTVFYFQSKDLIPFIFDFGHLILKHF